MTASTLTVNPLMIKALPYDVRRDFTPITQLVTLPNVLIVGADKPFRTVQEFLAAARETPGALTFGSAGVGSTPHFAMALLESMAGVELTHVPFTSVGQSLNDMLGGRVDSMMVNYLSGKALVDAGKLHALGVSSLKRSAAAPGLPTIAESGVPGYEANQWFGLLAPRGTPSDIVARLHEDTVKALRSAETLAILAAQGAEVSGDTPQEFAALIDAEMRKWADVATRAKIAPE